MLFAAANEALSPSVLRCSGERPALSFRRPASAIGRQACVGLSQDSCHAPLPFRVCGSIRATNRVFSRSPFALESRLVGRVIAVGRSDKITIIFKDFDFVPDHLRPLDISRGRIADLQSLRSGNLALQTEHEIRGGRGIVRGTEDLVLVFFQGLDPGTDVRGMIRGIVGNSDFGSNEDARQFGAKFLFGVVQIAESIRLVQRWAI